MLKFCSTYAILYTYIETQIFSQNLQNICLHIFENVIVEPELNFNFILKKSSYI